MKADLLYLGFENAVAHARNLGKVANYLEAVRLATGYVVMNPALFADGFTCGYIGVDSRRAIVWRGINGWVCIHESLEGVLELALDDQYQVALDKAGSDVRDYTRLIMNIMAGGLPFDTLLVLLDASLGDPTILENKLRPLSDGLRDVFDVLEAQLERSNVGDPLLRRRVEEELAGAVSTFYTDLSSDVQLRIFNQVATLIEDDRRFNSLTRLQAFQDKKSTAVSMEDVASLLAWILEYAYHHSVLIPMWDAVIAPPDAQYIPLPDASIRTVGVMSQLGKLQRTDPDFSTKVQAIMDVVQLDSRFGDFYNDHPGMNLWRAMYDRVLGMEGDDAANDRLSWPLYQLLLQYAIKHEIVH